MLSPPPNDPPQPAICFTMLDLCLHRTTLKSPTSRPCRSSITFAQLKSYAAVKTASTHQSLIGKFLRLRLPTNIFFKFWKTSIFYIAFVYGNFYPPIRRLVRAPGRNVFQTLPGLMGGPSITEISRVSVVVHLHLLVSATLRAPEVVP